MKRYFKVMNCEEPAQASENVDIESNVCHNVKVQRVAPIVQVNHVLRDMNELPADPGLRPCINSYDVNIREQVRRAYIQMGPCQPKRKAVDYPWKYYDAKTRRRFIPSWFNDFSTWLEYSVAKDAAYCLCCYLFKPELGEQGGGESFVGGGFSNWKDKSRLGLHVGDHNSVHNYCVKACVDLRNHKQHIEIAFCQQDGEAKRMYGIKLNASIHCVRFLLRQGLAFRGHDESENSINKGNFLELLTFLANHNEETNKATLSSPGNRKLVCHEIQKDIVNAFSFLTTQVILNDLGSGLFSILVDESRDISVKEQMALALRYVNGKGCVIECFLGLVHVKDTTSLSLKIAIESLLMKHKLSLSNIRGQGYDGASNMSGDFHGLKSLIMAENESAYYVHCFAHQLQLTLVAVAKNHKDVCSFFKHLSNLSNIIGVSSKRSDMFRTVQMQMLAQAIIDGELKMGRGLNQEKAIKRPGDTRWSSHFGSIISLFTLFPSVIRFLDIMVEAATCSDVRGDANTLIDVIHQFEFIFLLHLMKSILGITHDLSQALQKKDQDIVNAMTLVSISKQRFQDMREGGWEPLMNEVHIFCGKHNLTVPSMQDAFIVRGRPRRNGEVCTNLHRYKVDLFYNVIDSQLQELNNRFDKKNTELLLNMACLDPRNLFSTFNKARLIQLAKCYPTDYSERDIIMLENQLENYIYDVRSNDEFSNLKGIGELAKKMVEVEKDSIYPLVFLLIKLALTLPVGTATVERVFSAMKLLKSSLRNKMDDDWMNDCMVTYIEKEIFDTIRNEAVIQQFLLMKNRRLPS